VIWPFEWSLFCQKRAGAHALTLTNLGSFQGALNRLPKEQDFRAYFHDNLDKHITIFHSFAQNARYIKCGAPWDHAVEEGTIFYQPLPALRVLDLRLGIDFAIDDRFLGGCTDHLLQLELHDGTLGTTSSFPALTRLVFHGVNMMHDDPEYLFDMLFGCPALEILVLSWNGFDPKLADLSSPIIKLHIPNLEIIVIRDIEFSKCYMLLDILPDASQGLSVAIATNNASELVTVDEEARMLERVLAFCRTKGGDEKPLEATFSYSGTHVTYLTLGAPLDPHRPDPAACYHRHGKLDRTHPMFPLVGSFLYSFNNSQSWFEDLNNAPPDTHDPLPNVHTVMIKRTTIEPEHPAPLESWLLNHIRQGYRPVNITIDSKFFSTQLEE
jgi:hypothetical protein